jgi:hypothetical protein
MAYSDPFSFPYPETSEVVRDIDEGCRVCVHQTYCPAMYWFRRGGDSRGEREEPIVNKNMGRACTSWSTDRADMVKTVNDRDLDENDYMYVQGIGSEANRGGITGAVTGSPRR